MNDDPDDRIRKREDDGGFPRPRGFDEPPIGPAFPLKALPRLLRKFVKAVAASKQVPVTVAATMVLGSLSTVLQGRLCVQPKASDPGYIEHLNLMIIIVMDTSAGKSGSAECFLKPLKRIEALQIKECTVRCVAARFELLKIDAKLKDMEGLPSEQLDQKALGKLCRRRAKLQQIAARTGRMYAQDKTQEALARLLKSEGSISIIPDEVHLPTLLGSRWNGKSNIILLLQGYTGTAYTIDRVATEAIYIERPLISLLSAVQPSVIGELYGNEEVVSRGLAGRILCVFPGNRFGNRVFDTPAVPEELTMHYDAVVTAISELELCNGIPPRMVLGEEAFQLLGDYFEEIDDALGSGAIKQSMYGFAGKAHGNTARIAGILHVIKSLEDTSDFDIDTPIGGVTMKNAIAIMRCFFEHAALAHESDLDTNSIQRAVFVRIMDLESERFSANELFQAMKGSQYIRCADDLKRALAGLVDRNYLLEMAMPARSGAGRKPSQRYRVNMRAVELEGARANN